MKEKGDPCHGGISTQSKSSYPQGQKASDYDNSEPQSFTEEKYNLTHDQAEENNNDQAPNASFQEAEITSFFYTGCSAWSISEDYRCPTAAHKSFSNQSDGRQNGNFLMSTEEEGLRCFTRKGSLIQIIQKSLPSKEKLCMIKASSKSLDFPNPPVPLRPDLVQAVCYCARYQARPTQKHLKEVKRIFKYLKGTINMGLWYPKDSGFELTAFSDADQFGNVLDTRKKHVLEWITFLGDKLVSWMSKKQNCTAMSSAEAEYVALSASCAQVMWMRTQLQDYGFNYNKIPLYCDSQSAIAISCNPDTNTTGQSTCHTRTEYQLGLPCITKALPRGRLKYLVRRIGMRCLTPAELEVLTNESA
ncbi:hypothetical protein Tco_1284303 [Tanacetum coccineum]